MEFKNYSSQMFERWKKSTYQSYNDLRHPLSETHRLSAEDYRQAIQSYPRPFKINLNELSHKSFLHQTLDEAVD